MPSIEVSFPKKLQEEALARLPVNTLYIVLWIRNDPPRLNDFHWGYYLHRNAAGGTKYHIRNMSGGWIPDHGPTGGVFKSNFLCVLVQIANVPEEKHPDLDRAMRSHDGDINAIPGNLPRVTCRVWLMTILQALVQNGIVRCRDPEALQRECMEIGNQHSATAVANAQPRPVVKSRICL